jgi:hypothetical protein
MKGKFSQSYIYFLRIVENTNFAKNYRSWFKCQIKNKKMILEGPKVARSTSTTWSFDKLHAVPELGSFDQPIASRVINVSSISVRTNTSISFKKVNCVINIGRIFAIVRITIISLLEIRNNEKRIWIITAFVQKLLVVLLNRVI